MTENRDGELLPPSAEFANNTNQGAPQPIAGQEVPPAPTPPTPPAPIGTLSGASPLDQAPQATYRPDPPTQIALWAIVTTGLYTLMNVVSAFRSDQMIADLETSFSGLDSSGTADLKIDPLGMAIDGLTTMATVGSFVFLALWMFKIRQNLRALGREVSGPPAVEWWGWFVPVANIVLPFLGMRGITRGKVNPGLLIGWWLGWLAAGGISALAAIPILQGVDWSDFTLKDSANFDSLGPILGAAAAALTISWIFLVAIIRKTTARHLEL